ncbi:MAG: VCBS repeat-containing protein [Planctomycetaceae bacterium]|jgi:hypothetical protein
MNSMSSQCLVVAFAMAGLIGTCTAREPAKGLRLTASAVPAAEWPAYRRDPGLTGFSPLVGGFATAPHAVWTYDLGGSRANTEEAQLIDVHGDGRDELLRVLHDRIICQSVEGDRLWETQQLAAPQVIQIRDFAGDGSRGLLVASSTGVAHHRYMISGTTGKASLLYTCGNVFGRYERFGKLLTDVPGEQLCAWWSGDSEKRFGGSAARGVGYLWSFEDGVDAPTLRFHAEEEGTIYAPLHLFADMDGDGHTDMVMISHEAMWVYDLSSGKKTMQTTWGPQIRTYWAATAAVPLAEGSLPSLLMINPMIPGVQVVTQDGETARSKWKRLVGDTEDQYQSKVKIDRAAPDPFIDLDGDGEIEILAAVTNEHADGKVHLVIFGADEGERVYDESDQTVLTVDDLDGVDPPEVLLRDRSSLRICNWIGNHFVDRWRGENVTPLMTPAPPEGGLTRAVGARSSSVNMPLWRDKSNGSLFLLRFDDGVWSCRLTGDSLQRVQEITKHEVLSESTVLPRNYSWDGQTLTVVDSGAKRVSYEIPRRQSYSAMPPVVGQLGNSQRIVIREFSGSLVSLAADGSDRRLLIERSPSSLGVCMTDLDGDGSNEVLAPAESENGVVEIVAVDAAGKRKLQIPCPTGATETALGPTGRLGVRPGRWFVVRYQFAFENTRVVAYDGASGEPMWMRDYLGPERIPATKFFLHLPTAVYDVDADGSDDLIASSENWYEVISVVDNRSLTSNTVITAAVPGHWGAYATPILADIMGTGTPLVFHNNAYALTLLTRLDGTPVWHYGLTRDTTHASKAGLADLDGDGTIEIVTTRKDGLLCAFDAGPLYEKCQSCPVEQTLTAANHAGNVRWTFPVPAPLSDLATLDIDGDGRTELLCGSGDHHLYALRATGGNCNIMWEFDLGASVASPVIVDLDGDQKAEILVSTSDGLLHCLGGTVE